MSDFIIDRHHAVVVTTVERAVGPRGRDGLNVRGSVASSAALPSSGMSLGYVYLTETDGHVWAYTGSSAVGTVNGFIDTGAVSDVLPLPLYTVTGHGASLPAGESAISNYADQAAFEAAISPVAQGEKIQLAIGGVVRVLEGRWIAGAWKWKDVT